MKKTLILVIFSVIFIMSTIYVTLANGTNISYQNFDSVMKDITRINENASEQDKKTVRSNVFFSRTFFQPEAEQAIKGMMDPDGIDDASGTSSSGGDNTYFSGVNVSGFPDDLKSKTQFSREDLIRVAMSALDVDTVKEGNQPVPYFWGGRTTRVKGGKGGFNDTAWFKVRNVTAGGNDTSPKFDSSGNIISPGWPRPFGSDCSGFVAWTYSQLPDSQYDMAKKLKSVNAAGQYNVSTDIREDELKPGDIGVNNNKSHIGIYIGKDPKSNKRLFIHCGSGEILKGPMAGIREKGYVYERGSVRISYLKSNLSTGGIYPSNINGEPVSIPAVTFTKFARVMKFPED